MNPTRQMLINAAKDTAAMARLESNTKFTVFEPPKKRSVATLSDWVADHPNKKQSKSLRKLQEAYLESLGIF